MTGHGEKLNPGARVDDFLVVREAGYPHRSGTPLAETWRWEPGP